MIIGFDASKIPYTERRGWGQYSLQLIEALNRVDRENFYKLFYNHLLHAKHCEMFFGSDEKFETHLVRLPGRLLDRIWMYTEIPKIELFLGSIDIFHSPFERIPPSRCKKIVTIHDLIYLRLPEIYETDFYIDSLKRLKKICERADLLISVSQNTLEDICLFTDFPVSQIRVVPDGVNAHFKLANNHETERIRLKYALPKRFILYVGAASPNKNLERLLHSINILLNSNRFNCTMVFAGKLGWDYLRLNHKVHEMKLEENLKMLDYVPDQDLPALYAAASLFVFPSLYEGFGMPVLEAMACGTPVACSNTGALKEVADDAAILFDPYVPEEIAEAIHLVLSDDSLRTNLIRKGIERSDGFRWDSIARKVISIYKEIY